MVRFDQGIPRHLSLGEQRKLRNRIKHRKKIAAIHNRKLPQYKPRKQIQADIHGFKLIYTAKKANLNPAKNCKKRRKSSLFKRWLNSKSRLKEKSFSRLC